MTRIGRFVAGVGAVVLGLIVLVVANVVFDRLVDDPPVVVIIGRLLGSLALFGITTAALYTWSVDGRFVRSPKVER